jgi:tetratricopeptide (TPR) repeat protein
VTAPVPQDEEIARLRRRLKEDPRSTVFVALAEALRRTGRHAEALSTLRAGLRLHHDHPPARVVLARVHVDLGQRELAVTELEAVAAADTDNVACIGLLARLYLDAGRSREAATLVERLEMAGDPQAPALRDAINGPPLSSLARTDVFDAPSLFERWEARGDLERARRGWERLLERNPGHPAVTRRLSLLAARARGEPIDGADAEPGARAPLPGQRALEELLDAESDAAPPPAVHRHGALARALWRPE